MAARLSRGGIWTVFGGPDYASKPRPAVVVQDDAFGAAPSVTICPFTTFLIEAPLLRLPIEPSAENGLRVPSQLMVDKITTILRTKLQKSIGRLSDEDVVRLNRAVLVFLGLAGSR